MHTMNPVKSTAIEAIGHDPAKNTLRVRFHSGATYEYPDVSDEEHGAFVNADSIGQHFNRHILNRGGTRIED